MRRLVITVCPLEPGSVTLPVERGGRARRMNAGAIAERLGALIAERKLGDLVRLRAGCAGGCALTGPNVGVSIYPAPRRGEKPDQIAIGWKTYVYSLATLDCLATIIEENVGPARGGRRRRRRDR